MSMSVVTKVAITIASNKKLFKIAVELSILQNIIAG